MTGRRSAPSAAFLNVDLEIVSARSLRRLVAALEPSLWVLHSGKIGRRFVAVLELGQTGGKVPANPEAVIAALLDRIEALPAEPRRLWDEARSRTLDLGFESFAVATPAAGSAAVFTLTPATLARLAALGARLAWTVYPVSPVPDSRRA